MTENKLDALQTVLALSGHWGSIWWKGQMEEGTAKLYQILIQSEQSFKNLTRFWKIKHLFWVCPIVSVFTIGEITHNFTMLLAN